MSGCIRSVKWSSSLLLQGELLHFGVVLLPQQQSAAAAGDAAAARAWLAKHASISCSVDLLLTDSSSSSNSSSNSSSSNSNSSSSSSSSSSKAAATSALSTQFWEAQAFPIDSQETVSVRIHHYTYTPAAAAAAAAAASPEAAQMTPTAAAATAAAANTDALHCCIICDIRIPMRAWKPLRRRQQQMVVLQGPGSPLEGDSSKRRQSISVSSLLTVRRPLQVTTALMDSFMYVQIENSTDSIPVVVENVILRSVNSNAQGDLPVTLLPHEQYSVLLRLDESFLCCSATHWAPSSADSSKWGAAQGTAAKAVLPLCLKWRVSEGLGVMSV
ncbi:hypothetical protein, conserved [Eimeria acervulina]|uniref:Uncharacterized protein n=1 Tax=Eimeria acervulina TaxID=5801 RepID=U6GK89_EIMAC|nr:hypothetical protein, conserved [Eimeria acervulina]CDI79708.1 hypothetical protein, conserved [Eimeria acervulina]